MQCTHSCNATLPFADVASAIRPHCYVQLTLALLQQCCFDCKNVFSAVKQQSMNPALPSSTNRVFLTPAHGCLVTHRLDRNLQYNNCSNLCLTVAAGAWPEVCVNCHVVWHVQERHDAAAARAVASEQRLKEEVATLQHALQRAQYSRYACSCCSMTCFGQYGGTPAGVFAKTLLVYACKCHSNAELHILQASRHCTVFLSVVSGANRLGVCFLMHPQPNVSAAVNGMLEGANSKAISAPGCLYT